MGYILGGEDPSSLSLGWDGVRRDYGFASRSRNTRPPPSSLVLSPSLPLLPLLIRGLIRGKGMKRLALLKGGEGNRRGKEGLPECVRQSFSYSFLLFSSLIKLKIDFDWREKFAFNN
jgi:hypothetical protein